MRNRPANWKLVGDLANMGRLLQFVTYPSGVAMRNTEKDHTTRRFAACLIASVSMLSCISVASAAELTNLRCEYLADPLGIDVEKPRLSWVIESGRRGEWQTAYQVVVASTTELLANNQGDLWDSGKVASDQSIQVEYAGKPLESRMACHWKVRVWDKDGKASDWSMPALWTMGLLTPQDWRGKWIGLDRHDGSPEARSPEQRRLPARYLRRDFSVDKEILHAVAYICGLGMFELRLNGRKVGDHLLDPGLTQYDKRALYVTLNVGKELRSRFEHRGRHPWQRTFLCDALKVSLWHAGFWLPEAAHAD